MHVGVQLSQDVKFVAGDQVSLTHKEKNQTKSGNIIVVCVERRKDKLYLVGTPDPEMPPPFHPGPNKPYCLHQLLVCDAFL